MKTILYVDDEESLTYVFQQLAMSRGLKCITSNEPKQALRFFPEKKDEIDILVLDVQMPGMNGIELFRELRKIRPDIPTIFMSARSISFFSDLQELIKKLDIDFVGKPYEPAAIFDLINAMTS